MFVPTLSNIKDKSKVWVNLDPEENIEVTEMLNLMLEIKRFLLKCKLLIFNSCFWMSVIRTTASVGLVISFLNGSWIVKRTMQMNKSVVIVDLKLNWPTNNTLHKFTGKIFGIVSKRWKCSIEVIPVKRSDVETMIVVNIGLKSIWHWFLYSYSKEGRKPNTEMKNSLKNGSWQYGLLILNWNLESWFLINWVSKTK